MFREAIQFTAAQTRFLPRLIEKDYFCSLLLDHLAAIRDFYDIDYAVRKLGFHPLETAMTELVRQKLSVVGNEPVEISPERLAALRQQLGTELKTVLREKDFAEFNLDRAYGIVTDVAAMVG